MSTVGVAIGTYGDRSIWGPLARVAVESVEHQTSDCRCSWVHGATLHEARNEAAELLINDGVEWLIFLDADDRLDSTYVLAMQYTASMTPINKNEVFQPSVVPVVNGIVTPVFFNRSVSILQQNYLPIGCMHSAELFTRIGGFDDWPMLEDWAYWCKAYVNGAKFEPAPDAIYMACIDDERPGRNTSQSPQVEAETCAKIRSMYSFLAKKQGLG